MCHLTYVNAHGSGFTIALWLIERLDVGRRGHVTDYTRKINNKREQVACAPKQTKHSGSTEKISI